MSIKIEINIPDDEIEKGDAALAMRMAVLGYSTIRRPFIMKEHAAPDPLDSPYIKANGEVMTLGEAMRAEQAAEQPKEEPKKRGRKAKAEEPQIRANPENRVEPEAVDDEATAAQDEADEQAEVEATRAPETPVTIDDLKKVVGDYVSAFSIPIAQEDGPKIFKSVLGDPPAGAAWTFPVLAGLPQDQLAKVVSAWKNAVAEATTAKKRFGGV